jgi:hypothetical protein
MARQIHKFEDYIPEGKNNYDPNKPSFKMKVNVTGLSRQRAEEQMNYIKEDYISDDYNMFILPVTETQSDIGCFHIPDNDQNTKPYFKMKINIAGMSKARAESHIADLIAEHNSDDYNMVYIPITEGHTDIECFYDPKNAISNIEIEKSKYLNDDNTIVI